MADITVFCAVWHQDPKRHELVLAHRENLRRQTIPVEAIYVFDGDDTPPPGLQARTIRTSEPLTIYQAWNTALAAVTTPLVMNLNLDDRLTPDGVERLAAELQRSGAALVGGDWRVCYSQEETDAVTPAIPAAQWPFVQGFPPVRGTQTSLGCSRGTLDSKASYGPATLWHMAVHRNIPRYPWRCLDGRPLRIIADALFWYALERTGERFARLPWIIGNYHSHPAEQAEFRHGGDAEEWRHASAAGVDMI